MSISMAKPCSKTAAGSADETEKLYSESAESLDLSTEKVYTETQKKQAAGRRVTRREKHDTGSDFSADCACYSVRVRDNRTCRVQFS